jgi:hypothetical protein
LSTSPLEQRAQLRVEIEQLAKVSRELQDRIESGLLPEIERAKLAAKRRVIASQRGQLETKLSKLKADNKELFEASTEAKLAALRRGAGQLVDRWRDLGAYDFASELESVVRASHD